MVLTDKIRISHHGVEIYNKRNAYSQWDPIDEISVEDSEFYEALNILFKDIYKKFNEMQIKYDDLEEEYDSLRRKYDYLEDYAYSNLCLIEDLNDDVGVLKKDVSDVVVKLED